MNTPENPLWRCPDGVIHRFRDLRARNRKDGPPFFFFQRCVRCTTIKVQVVDSREDGHGNIVPTIKTYLEEGDRMPLPGGAVGASVQNQKGPS